MVFNLYIIVSIIVSHLHNRLSLLFDVASYEITTVATTRTASTTTVDRDRCDVMSFK